MIIDSTYIKDVLNIEVDNQVINYLIKHFFNDICRDVGLDSTLAEEELVTLELEDPIENPNILEDDLTLFQETLIYGIACDLIQTGLIPNTVTEQLFQFYKDQIEDVTYCNMFDYCFEQLDAYLNSMSEVDYVRKFLFLNNKVTDDELAFLIQHYKEYLISCLPKDSEVDTDSWLFKQALLMQIACHIFKLKPNLIGKPKSYKVDEVRVTWTLNFDKEGNTWCDLAEEALADLKKKYYNKYGFVAWNRPGARTKYGYHGPGGQS